MKPNILYNNYNWDFPRKQVIDGHEFEYKNNFEIGMAGPVCGELYIDGNKVKTDSYGKELFSKRDVASFGMPFFLYNEKVFVPMFRHRVFRMTCIDLKDLSFKVFGDKHGIMMITEVKDNIIHYSIRADDINLGMRTMAIPSDCI